MNKSRNVFGHRALQAMPWRATLCSLAAMLPLVGGLLPNSTHAALTDISSTPLAGTPSVQVKPNIMLLMDASGSMGWSHMPDDVETVTGIKSIGYKSSQCNSLYYNPATNYLLPKKPDPLATPFTAPSFTAAPYAGYASYYVAPTALQTSVVNLSTSFQAYDATTLRTATAPDTAQPAYYYVYSGGPAPSATGAPCTDLDTYATDGLASKAALGAGGGTWTRKTVSATSGPGATDERANFAMWYSFYRIRISMIKSASSIAFNSLTDSFRVGFILMQPKDSPTDAAINPSKFLAINDFNITQRGLWFNSLFSQIPSGASPAREGLARVGRYYAGKQNSINAGMPATGANDPVQYSCQRNFTIMTTDGYWNSQTESPSGGAVDLNGNLLTASQDSDLSNPLDQMPIYDGSTNGTQRVEDHENSYVYASCGTFAYMSTSQTTQSTSQTLTTTSQIMQSTTQALQSTRQNLYSTVQNRQSTSQTTQSTTQPLQSTTQNLQSTVQNLQSTVYATQSTSQNLQSTLQNRQSTTQNLQSTTQNVATATQVTMTVSVVRQSTTQNLRSTTQNLQNTTQTTQSTAQRLQSTVQNLQSTAQNRQSTTQTTQSTTQALKSTTQALQSTTQNLRNTAQVTQSTSQATQSTSQTNRATSQQTVSTSQTTQTTVQDQSCDARTELCTYVSPGSCTAGGFISCQHYQAGPSLVASCATTSPTAGNNYLSTTCATTSTAPAGTASCTPASATAGNNYTTTSCSTALTGPTPVASCSATAANSGNGWTATTCSNLTSGPTVVASCTATPASSGNSWTATTCGANTTAPTGVASCTAAPANSGNGYVATTCGNNNTSNVPVASCAASGPTSGNAYTTTTCGTNNTSNVPVASCAASGPTAGNGYTTTTCSSNNTSNVPVASCAASGANAGNSFVATTCTSNNTGPTGVASCSAVAASAGNSYTATTCGSNNTTNVPIASCAASGPTAGNGYTTTTCNTNNTSNVPVASCAASGPTAGNGYTTTTCGTNNTSNVPVASCTASGATSGNGYVTTSCVNNNTGPTGVAACVAVAASAANSYTATTCGSNNSSNVPVASCAASGPTAGNSYTTTTCGTNNTTNVPVASCASSSPNSGNGYTNTTCSTNNTSNVLVATCAASGPTAGNGYTTTSCAPSTISGPTVVASCTPAPATAGNGFQTTSCGTIVVNTPVAACVPSGPTAGNNYTTTTCGTNNTTNVPVASCVASGPTAGNNYTTTTCSTNNTTNVPVAACAASGPTAGNGYTTTTCPAPVTSGPTPVATCTAAGANAGNSFVATSCTVGATGPTAVASCSPISPTSGNAYTTTTCGSVVTTNVPVASCVASGPTSGNGYKTTTCGTNNTANVPVASCAASGPTAGNGYTTTSCGTNNTSNVPVPSCAASGPTAGNSYVTTSCSTNATGPVGVASCAASGPTSGNNYTTTTCGSVVTTNVAVASCTASGPTSGNSYVTTTCPAPVTTGPLPIGTCTASGPTAGNGYVATSCPAPIVTTNVAVATCTAAPATSGNSWTSTTCASNVTGPTAVASCTPTAASSGNSWTATTCNTVPTTTATASCTASGPTAANSYTTTTCPAPLTTGPTAVASCTASGPTSANAYLTTTCNTATTAPSLQPSCLADPPTSANNYTTTTCVPAPGRQINYTTLNTLTTTQTNGVVAIGVPTVVTSTTGPLAATACYSPLATPPVLPASPSPAGVVAGLGTVGPVPPSGCSAWPCTTSTVTPPTGSVNSLADVAQYYYATPLRTGALWPASGKGSVKPVGDLPAVESDDATWQHMTTFAVGLGVSGTLTFDPNYRDAATTTGDFAQIRLGTKSWPFWPNPSINYDPATGGDFNNWNDARSIDDFWHAAVNGRGQYFSAKDPTSVVAGLSAALGKIDQVVAAGSGAATSTFQPVAGDNFAYLGSYTTGVWSGELAAWPIDLTTGLPQVDATGATAPIWSAQGLLAARTAAACDTRQIYLMKPGAPTNNMLDFSSGTRSCDGSGNPTGAARTGLTATEMAYFSSTQIQLLSQYASMTDGTLGTVDQRGPAVGSNLVNFLRGQRGLEKFSPNVANELYRKRAAVLGDFIDSQPVYVSKPLQIYQDTGYSTFASANATRTPMLYAGANDGMLHAFYAGTSVTDPQRGQEAWAVIPSAVLPNLYKLADANYKNTHQFFVDGTPTVGDAFDTTSGTWKTILVGGLNAGGKGYYALDVTDPAAPKGLWEFNSSTACWPVSTNSDCFIGLTFGQPLITKIAYTGYPGGRWVVIVTSGYNNVHASPIAGDGRGYLYILDAITGQIIDRIDTGAGSASTPSGLAQVSAFANNGALDNSAVWVYGGDLLGNVWRFDVNDALPPAGREATLIGQATDPGGTPQPITVRPELAEITGQPMVLIGTGEFLGSTDIASTQVQSVYGIVDPLTTGTAYPNLRASLSPMSLTQTGSADTAVRTVACTAGTAAQCFQANGWVLDLNGEAGERVNVPMNLIRGELIVASNVPSAANAACTAGGDGFLNYLNFTNGTAIGATTTSGGLPNSTGLRVSDYVAGGLITGVTPIYLPSIGKYKLVTRTSDGKVTNPEPPAPPPQISKGRISWREITE